MKSQKLLVGVGAGAALAYLLDPARGGRRRALIRDQVVRTSRKTRDGLDAAARDLANRTRGVVAATRRRLDSAPVDDARLMQRVRAKLGRVCSHPRAIDVDTHDGDATLRGPILAHELSDVLAAAAAVPGVTSVTNQLELHDSAEGVPSLQGGGKIARPRLDLLQRHWAPATQALVAAAAGLAATGVYLAASGRREPATIRS
ncbi:MAG TPA: BON domain-containing protein [Vicinamibacterales bacterium]|nr:BON domain-containing protein [Vicinamibacterales bacterium]